MFSSFDPSTVSRPFRTAIAGLTLAISGSLASADACDCGCDSGACDDHPYACDSCECETSRPRHRGIDLTKTPVYKTLDLLAGGIEKVLRLDEDHCSACDEEASCDDGCDIMLMRELSAPMPSMKIPVPPASPPKQSHSRSPSASPYEEADRVIRPVPRSTTLPRVDAPVYLDEPTEPNDDPSSAPILSAPLPAPSDSGLESVVPEPISGPNDLQRISKPIDRRNPSEPPSSPLRNSRPTLRPRTIQPPTLPDDDQSNPFLDDPFQSTPLGDQQVMGSGLRQVQYQHQRTQPTAPQHHPRQVQPHSHVKPQPRYQQQPSLLMPRLSFFTGAQPKPSDASARSASVAPTTKAASPPVKKARQPKSSRGGYLR